MPRKVSEKINFRQEEDAKIEDVVEILVQHSDESLSRLDEGNDIDRRLLVGNETHVWDNEILLEGEG